MIATVIILTVVGGFMGGLPRYAGLGAVLGTTTIGPMTWWLYTFVRHNKSARSPNIFYENSLTKADIELIQHTDMIENLAHKMRGE